MKKDYLEVAKIVNTHGVRGELKAEPWCDTPAYIKQFRTLYLDQEGKRPVTVTGARIHGASVLLTLEGVDCLEKAERLKNRVLYLDRRDAPLAPGAYFIQDLIGCRILDETTGGELGTVEEVNNYGASDVWRIRRNGNGEFLIPNIPEVVKEVQIDQGFVKIHVMKGLLQDED